MCGRFAITLPSDAMAQLFEAQPDNDLPDVPNYNVCPTNAVHMVVAGPTGRRLTMMRWGFVPNWYKKANGGPLLINARCETIAEKPAFRAAARERRGLLVASGFYEWTKTPDYGRDPWYVFAANSAPLAMAAIWQNWIDAEGQALRTCAIVTTAANATMRQVHHRMPVVVERSDWPLWLGEAGHGAATLMRAAPEDLLETHRVDRAVNSNRAAGAELIAAI
ncbi:MAG: SOS response-associated peptidase [Roseobacter sp.]